MGFAESIYSSYIEQLQLPGFCTCHMATILQGTTKRNVKYWVAVLGGFDK